MEMGLACLIVLNVLGGQKVSFQDHQKMQEAIKVVAPKCEKESKKYIDEMKAKAEKQAKEKAEKEAKK